ncbi:MAG: LptF/LptG family permease [Melioribacteraceae bacterium]|nr:LptF/LptG family permease [Melioribacteraceae bacterium]MDD3557298.1 LptF/LptG family permease [Melioribacteraceae bacterium]
MIIFRYILKNHVAPFLFSNFILIAVLLLQYLMKISDLLIGKGLSFWIISQLIIYSMAWMLVLVVPMAALVSTIMAFGSMAQNNEIAIFKATGISLYKMMIPPLLGSMIVAALLIQFNNNIYPHTNHQARLLLQNITQQKPTLSLVPGVFSQDVQNYSILVRSINPETSELENLTIYDYSDPYKTNIVTAERGKIYFSKDQKKLIMDLVNGEIHESDNNVREPYRKLIFEKHRIAMKGDQFSYQASDFGGQRGERELGASEMLVIVDSLSAQRNNYLDIFKEKQKLIFFPDTVRAIQTSREPSSMKHVYLRVKERIKNNQNNLTTSLHRLDANLREQNKYWVEIHKKYSLPFACIVFVLIGAPLGTMTRKGGFGIAAGISLAFFLVYWFFLIGGEKLADRGLVNPFWGMWSANFLLFFLGIFLTIKSARERVTISFDWLIKLIPKQLRDTEKTDVDT